MKRCGLLLVIALVVCLSATSAQATLLSIEGDAGTYGSVQSATNDLLVSIYGTDADREGYFGNTVELTAPAYLTFTFLGFEAGYHNEFNFDEAELFRTEDHGSNWETGILGMAGLFYPTAEVIPFSFDVNSDSARLTNGINAGVNFFVSFDGSDPSATMGNSLIVFLDDGGANFDKDYDDFAVRIEASPVPEPATMLLLGAGLLGLAGLRRKFKRE